MLKTNYFSVIITLLFLLINATTIAQTKKEVQFSLDTLLKSKQKLQEDFNDVRLAWTKQNAFFEHVKANLFDPSDINTPIEEAIIEFDKINNALDVKIEEITDDNKLLTDSLNYYKNQYQQSILQSKIYKNILNSALSKASFPQAESGLKGNWDLFLNPVQINGDPFNSGLISFNPFSGNDSIIGSSLSKIEFGEDEIASLYFKNGEEQKSFYSVNNFSLDKPYSIVFTKSDEFKLTLHVTPLPSGLMVSYENANKTDKVIYFYGLMKK